MHTSSSSTVPNFVTQRPCQTPIAYGLAEPVEDGGVADAKPISVLPWSGRDDDGCVLARGVVFGARRDTSYNWPLKTSGPPIGGHWNQTEVLDQIS